MADVVGLRFVTTGEREAIAAYDRYKAGLLSLGQVQDKHVAAFNRRAREELRAINDVARAAAQAARVRQQAAQSYNQLAGSMYPAVAATNRLQAAQKVLQNAFDQGVISAQKKAAMLRQLNAQYKADELNRYAAAQRKVSDTIIQGDAVVKRLSGDMQLLTERLKQGTVTQQQHDTALKALAHQLAINNNYVKANGQLNVQKAMAELRATEATRAAAAADAAAAATKARLSQSYNQLLASINPVIARQQQTRQTVDMLRAAVAAGAITTTQAAQALLQYRNALRQMDVANQIATRGMNRVGVITQQAGYQVGDFIVQIQSGTNVMVALGQQATQLIGTFAMLARTTRGIAIFSALGVAVPILTAVGAAIMRASGESDTLEKKLQKLDQSADKLGRTLDRLEDTDLAEKFGNLTDEVISISNAMGLLDESAQLKNLIGVLDRVEDAASANVFRKFFEGMASGLTFNLVGAGAAQSDEKAFQALGFGMARSQFLSYTEELKRLAQSGDKAGVVAEFNRFIQDATDNGAELSMSGIALAASIEKAALQTAETAARLNGSAQAAKDAAEAEKQLVNAIQSSIDYRFRKEEQLMAQIVAIDEDVQNKRIAASDRAIDQRYSKEAQLMGQTVAISDANAQRSRGIVSAQERAIDQRYSKEAQLMGQTVAISDANAQRSRDIVSRQERYIDQRYSKEAQLMGQSLTAVQSQTVALMDQTALARRRLEILQSYNAEGQKTPETLMLELALASELLREQELRKLATDGITQAERDAVDELVEANAKIMQVEAGLANAASAAKGLTAELRAAASAMASLAGMGASVDVRIAGLEAEINAYAQGLNTQAERKRATELEKARQERDKAFLAPGADVAGVDAVFQGVVQRLDKEAALTTKRDAIVEAQREDDRAAKRGGTAARKDEQYLYKLEQEAIAQRALIGLSEEQRIQDERRAQITLKLSEDGRALTVTEQQRIEKIIAMEAETRKLIEAEQQREQLMQTIEGNIKSAFMSMVDGSQSVEDAFRSMLRNILLAVYEQQVAAPAAKGISNFLSNIVSGFTGGITAAEANGGGWNNGVKFFANGGVVGSPTMFGHSGGLGVMGEAGPEAIMPLKRGSDGKLGVAANGGSLTVNVVMDPSTGALGAFVQDQAGQVVAKAAPQLAQYANKTMVDQRRRGGTMKAAFRG